MLSSPQICLLNKGQMWTRIPGSWEFSTRIWGHGDSRLLTIVLQEALCAPIWVTQFICPSSVNHCVPYKQLPMGSVGLCTHCMCSWRESLDWQRGTWVPEAVSKSFGERIPDLHVPQPDLEVGVAWMPSAPTNPIPFALWTVCPKRRNMARRNTNMNPSEICTDVPWFTMGLCPDYPIVIKYC